MHSNKKLCRKIPLLCLALGLSAAAPTLAADDYNAMNSVYVGGGGGKSQDQEIQSAKKTSGKAFAGYEFNKALSVETGYVDLGKHDIGSSNSVREHGPFLEALIHFPVSEAFSPFLKGGVHRLEITTYTAGENNLEKNIDPTWGAGLNFDIGRHMGLRFEWERFKIKNHDTDLVVANLVHYFR